MRNTRAFVVSMIVILLTGCSALAPYPTYPSAARSGGDATATRVAICSNTLVSTVNEVQVAAQQECPSNTTATHLDTDWYLRYCPLLLPAHVTFVCTPNK
jgi:hypothetical protein